jgi:hypothetical protein
MSTPNILTTSSIVGVSTFLNLTSTSATVLVTNPASSNKIFKVNSIIVANDSNIGVAKISVRIHNAANGGGVGFNIANNVSIANEATLILIDRASSIYLEEDRSIVVQANTANYLDIICSFETIL